MFFSYGSAFDTSLLSLLTQRSSSRFSCSVHPCVVHPGGHAGHLKALTCTPSMFWALLMLTSCRDTFSQWRESRGEQGEQTAFIPFSFQLWLLLPLPTLSFLTSRWCYFYYNTSLLLQSLLCLLLPNKKWRGENEISLSKTLKASWA